LCCLCSAGPTGQRTNRNYTTCVLERVRRPGTENRRTREPRTGGPHTCLDPRTFGPSDRTPGPKDPAYNEFVSVVEHKSHAPRAVACFVLTVSDTRTPDNDASGRAIRELLEADGHIVTGSRIVRDEPDQVTEAIEQQLAHATTRIVITTGGTGITSRDGTFEAIDRLFEKRLDGFGELFRMISFEEIGPAAMMTRAVGGTIARKAVFVLPGSEHAVRLALTRLILPELGHIVQQLDK
jgi:molybdenum cofactor biosynthesis protein B